MPGELLTLHVGQCGNQIGQSFWKALCEEHAIDSRGGCTQPPHPTDNKDVFFYQADDDHYVPRAVLVDLEPRVINGILQSQDFGNLFNKDNVYLSEHGGGAGNNWASGFKQGSDRCDDILDMIEREAGNCELLEGFLVTHSVSGGTGSGMGSALLEKLRERFPKKVIQTFSVFADNDSGSDVVVSPYNTVLSMQRLIEHPDNVVVLDNAALNKLALGKFRLDTPSFEHINSLVIRIMSMSTASFRFSSPLFTSFRHLSVSLAPFYPMHFIQAGISPIVDPTESFTRKTSVANISMNLMKPAQMMVSTAEHTNPKHCMLAATMLLQGSFDISEMDSVLMTANHAVNKIQRAPWARTNPLRILRSVNSPYVKPQYKVSGLMLNNSTSIAPLFDGLLSKFRRMRGKNAYMDRFEKEDGFDSSMMDEAAESVDRLCKMYSDAEKPDFLRQ